jgi:N-acetylglucosaminyldiphosphoundecaprenol N-acetyl-beta-D-mannosaminyltransferase
MVNILTIPFFDKNIPAAISMVLHESTIKSVGQNRCISATGAHGLIEAHKNPSFKTTLDQFWLNLPDGMPTVWVGRLKGAKEMKRCYGPDFFMETIKASSKLPIKHFFCGGKQGIAEQLRSNCAVRFGNNQVVGTFSPPFREMSDQEMAELAATINQSGASIVWIGLSTPKQEQFALRLAQFTQTKFIITVGAAFDFHTDQLKQAPKWMQKSGLEWFFRVLMEPKRLFMRYFEIVPQFIWLNIKEFVDFCILKRKDS